MRSLIVAATVAMIGSGGVAKADSLVVSKVTARVDGAQTIVTVNGSGTPSFTVYRLERPSRLVVDLANGRLAPQLLADGPVDVDSWAVGQIASAQYADENTRTARVMIGFKRPANYDVRAKGHDVVVTITPEEAPPAQQLVREQTRVDEARGQRVKVEADLVAAEHAVAVAEKKRKAAEAAVAQAEEKQRATEAATASVEEQRKAAEAATRDIEKKRRAAEAASAEVEQKRRVAETAMAAVEKKRLAAEVAANAAAHAVNAAEEKRRLAEAAVSEVDGRRRAAEAAVSEVDGRRRATEEKQRRAEAEVQRLEKQRMELAQKTDALRWQTQSLEAAREKALAAARSDEAKRAQALEDAKQADEEARRTADRSRREADEAKTRAQAASSELGRVLVARKALEAEVRNLKDEASRTGQAAATTNAELVRLRAERAEEQKRLEKLRTEAEARVLARTEEMSRLAEVQVNERRLAGERAAKLELERQAAERRARASSEARETEEKKVRARAEEAERLAQAASAARSLKHAEAAVKTAEARAKAAADATAIELQRLQKLRTEARTMQAAAEAARSDVDGAKREAAQLLVAQELERRRLEEARAEARRQAGARADAVREVQISSALASRSRGQLEAAEREARKVADERAREVKRLEEARAEAQSISRSREESLHKLDEAREVARKKVAAEEAALAALAARRSDEEKRLKAAEAALDERVAAENKVRSETGRLQSEAVGMEARVEKARVELLRLQAEAQKRAQPLPKTVPELPVVKLGRLIAVRNIKFVDDEEKSRVIVELSGNAKVTQLSGAEGAVLRLDGVSLPTQLVRTLDVSAYKGPLASVSSYADPSDPSAVRLVAKLDGARAGDDPKVVRDGNQIVWEFQHARRTQSYAPTQVSGYSAAQPLQLAGSLQTIAPSGGRKKVYTGRRITFDFKDIDIHNVIRILGDVGGVNVVVSDDVKGSVTISMKDVPWDQALDVVLKAKGLGMQRDGNLIRVAPAAVLEKELEAEVARARAEVDRKPISTRLIPLSYAEADKVLPRVADLMSPRGKVSFDARTNTLIVSDVAGNISLAEELVGKLDSQTPQVLIEARIVEARSTFTRDIGIQWGGNSLNSAATGNPTGLFFPSTVGVAGGSASAAGEGQGLQSGATSPNYVVNMPAAVGSGSGGALGLTLGAINGALNINLRLSSLENTGNVRIISAPKVTTLDNVEATIEQGVSIPISVTSAAGANTVFVDAKLNMTVKPHVTNDSSVIMKITITRNEPDFVNTGARGDPTILKKQAKTEMLVRDGDTGVIGGIYTRNSGLSYTKVPWVADIPVIGWLFKNRRENDDRTELLIFITPRIVNRAAIRR